MSQVVVALICKVMLLLLIDKVVSINRVLEIVCIQGPFWLGDPTFRSAQFWW